MDIEVIMKWALIGGVAIGGMFFLYKFAQSQGWVRQSGGLVTRKRGGNRRNVRFAGPGAWRMYKNTAEWQEKPTIIGTLPAKGSPPP